MSASYLEPVVQWALRHHIIRSLLVSDFAKTTLAFPGLVSERPEDVTKLLHVLRTDSVANVADERRTWLVFV